MSRSAKLAEIAAAKKQVDNKSVELANTDEANAQAKEDLADTRNALSADQKFLLDLKEKCRMSDAEMEERTKARQAEIAAVGEAIAILTSDESRDLFSSTLGFVQVRLRPAGCAKNATHLSLGSVAIIWHARRSQSYVIYFHHALIS